MKYHYHNYSLILFLLFILPFTLRAGEGFLRGTVRDAVSGEALVGASIYLEGKAIGGSTNRSGEFYINRVPEGVHTLVVSYLGYRELKAPVIVGAGSTTQVEANMKSVVLESGEIMVVGSREGQAKALNLQRVSDNIKNIVAADQIVRFPDPNTAEALQRVPGISIQRDQGEGRFVKVRGTEARLNAVTINGERVPAPEGDVRFVALDVIPVDILAGVEVSKTLTPDMDGDAIGGAINLVTKSAFDYEERLLKVTTASGYNHLVDDVNFQGAATYGQRFGKDKQFGVLFSGNYYETQRGSDNNEMEWDFDAQKNFYVLNELQLRDYMLTRRRLGLSANVDWRPHQHTALYLRGIFNYYSDHEVRRRLNIRFDKADSLGQLTAASGEFFNARTERDLKERREIQQISGIYAGGNHLLSSDLALDYQLSFSHAREKEPERRDLTVRLKGVDLSYDISNTDIPRYRVTNSADPFDPASYQFEGLSLEDNETTDRNITAAVNIERPYSLLSIPGELKFGFKYRHKNKERNNEVQVYDGFKQPLTLADLVGSFDDPNFLDNHYRIGRFPDPDRTENLVVTRMNQFELDRNATLEESLVEDYKAREAVLAGYLMTRLKSGRWMALPGFRFEQTRVEYRGNIVRFDQSSHYIDTQPITRKTDYDYLLPMLQLKYELNKRTNIRFAAVQSLARPNYSDLVPFRLVNREDEEIETGNPDLIPTKSNNLDLLFEHYLPAVGIVSAGFFYKDIAGFIFSAISKDSNNFKVTRPKNGDDAQLYGFEFAWQQQLTFLPGVLSGLGIYSNYTFVNSEATFPNRLIQKLTLPGQAKHVGNVAVSYEKSGFSGRLSLNYHSSYLLEVDESERADIYQDKHLQLDFSASQQIVPGLSAFVEVLNLNNEPLRRYQGDPEHPIQREFYSWWSHLGLRFNF